MSETSKLVWPSTGHTPTYEGPLPDGYIATALFDPFEIFCGPYFNRPEGPVAMAFRVDKRHVNLQGILHGGALLTFADSSMGFAVWAATDRTPCVTVSMQASFLKAARIGDLVEVEPELTRKTRELVFMRGDYKVAGTTIATITSLWKLLKPAP